MTTALVNQAIQQATTTAGGSQGVSRERLDQLYNELFGRTTGAQGEGAEYWMASGLTGEALRDALIAGAQGTDAVNFQDAQQTSGERSYAQRASDVDQMYRELFGRPAEQAGLEHWLSTGLTGEALRDQLVSTASQQGEDAPDRQGFINRQVALATGEIPTGYRTYTSSGQADGQTPPWFQEYIDQYNSMQEQNLLMQNSIDELNALLAGRTSGGGNTTLPGTNVGQPGGGTSTGQTATGTTTSGVFNSFDPSQSTQQIAGTGFNPYRTSSNLTPEMLDAYRFQQFYTQAPSLVPRVDQGVGSLSYFGIPPSQIQASLSGF